MDVQPSLAESNGRPAAGPVLSFHRLRFRPTALSAHARFMLRDPQSSVAGLRQMVTGITGTTMNQMVAPPHPSIRTAVGWWDDEEAYYAFCDTEVSRRWSDAASERYDVLLHPYASRGTWHGKEVLPELPRTAADPDGQMVVVTGAVMPFRWVPEWQFSRTPRHAYPMTQSEGILTYSVGASTSLRQVFTFSSWTDARAMRRAAYRPDAAHQTGVKWIQKRTAKQRVGETSFVRCTIGATSGSWGGRDPLHADDGTA